MIVAELALLTERHGETSKEVKMRHQYSGRFFVKRENKTQNHQHSNLHHLYIAEILTKLQAIYDATLWKGIVARFKISDRERSIHDAITQQPQSIYDAMVWRSITPGSKNQTQKSRSIYDAMVWRIISIGDGLSPHPILSMTVRHRIRYSIYDVMS